MKTLLTVLTFLLIIGCAKEKNTDDPYWGTATADKNGIPWVAQPYSAFEKDRWGDSYIDIIVRYLNADKQIREGITFIKIPMAKGTYDLEPDNLAYEFSRVATTYNTFEDDGHILGDSFTLDTTAVSNKVEVLSFDKGTGNIEIRFSATYIISQRRTMETVDTIRFENGYVNTKVTKY